MTVSLECEGEGFNALHTGVGWNGEFDETGKCGERIDRRRDFR